MADTNSQDYRPTEDEPYMNDDQREYFRRKLLSWRDDILRGSNETLRQLKEEESRVADMSDWASFETERNFQLRARDRERKLLSKIDEALRRIEEGTLWILRGDPGADRPASPGGPPDRHVEHRSSGASRASRENLPRRMTTRAARRPAAKKEC